MVGVPRSTGCPLCVKRRVKCDETRPGCGNCAKYGAVCPGYDKAFKFVAGKHQTRHRHRQHVESSTPSDDGSVQAPRSGGARPEFGLMRTRTRPALTISPSENRIELIGALLQNLDVSERNQDLRAFAPWFEDASQRLGKNMILDCATMAFVLHLLGKAKEDDTLVWQSRAIYGQSLGSLQKALNHPVDWKSSEVLCATMMMCYFELFAGTTDAHSWMKHATGVSCLIQQRGPGAYDNPWDHSMLLSFRAIIIMNSLFSLQDCFLARKSWQKVLLDVGMYGPENALRRETEAIYGVYLANLAKVPHILRRGLALREAKKHNMPIDVDQVLEFLPKVEKLRVVFETWFKRFEKLNLGPTEAASKDPGSIYETVLYYKDVWAGGLYMGYWATMLILQESLNQCHYTVDYTISNREFMRNILRSVECVGADLLGPYRVGYSMRIAYEFADVQTQTWITSLIARFEKRYASTSPEGYPAPAPNEFQYR